MKIDTQCNFILPVDGGYSFFVPQPSKYEVMNISKILGYFYKQIANDEVLDVIVVDWERILNEVIETSPNGESLKSACVAFLDKCELSAVVKLPTNEIKPCAEVQLDEDVRSYFKGTLLFILALSRYASAETKKLLLKDFITSLNSMEWIRQSSQSSTSSTDDTSLEESDSKKSEEQTEKKTAKISRQN